MGKDPHGPHNIEKQKRIIRSGERPRPQANEADKQ